MPLTKSEVQTQIGLNYNSIGINVNQIIMRVEKPRLNPILSLLYKNNDNSMCLYLKSITYSMVNMNTKTYVSSLRI